MSEDSDDERVVEVGRIRKFRNPFERTVVEQPSDFFSVRDGEQPDSEQRGNEREPVRSGRPRIREIVGFPDVP